MHSRAQTLSKTQQRLVCFDGSGTFLFYNAQMSAILAHIKLPEIFKFVFNLLENIILICYVIDHALCYIDHIYLFRPYWFLFIS